jgi:hypothetical protein
MENTRKPQSTDEKVLTYEAIKAMFPDEWILLSVLNAEQATARTGLVLLHSKDYLELCYKGSEIAKDKLTTIFFTGEQQKYRKWMKVSRLSGTAQTT